MKFRSRQWLLFLTACSALVALTAPSAAQAPANAPDTSASVSPSNAAPAPAPEKNSPPKPKPKPPTTPEPSTPQVTRSGPERQARSLYEAGAIAFANQNNAEAISYFRRAARMSPNPKLTYNIGLAYEDMGDPSRALTQYLFYLQQQPHSQIRSEVTERIQRLEQSLAVTGLQQVIVSTSPPGATVLVDGEPRGISPYAGDFVPGAHAVSLQMDGYAEANSSLQLQPDHAFQIRITLEREAVEVAPKPAPRVRPLSWSLLSVGVVSFAGGTAFEFARAAARDRARRANSFASSDNAQGAANAHQMASFALFGFGTGLLVAGGLLAFEDLLPTSTETTADEALLQLPCGQDFCGVLAGASF